MRIALAQINPILGDFQGNSTKIIEFSRRALERRADMVLFPEATLFGYHPMDLLERPSIIEAELKVLQALIKKLPREIAVVFGAFTKNPRKQGKPYFNSAVVAYRGKIIFSCNKELLPTYDVFDDARYIEPGDMRNNVFKFKGKRILLTICEDIWAWPQRSPRGSRSATASAGETVETYYPNNPLKKIRPGSVDFILNLSASPFFDEKFAKRKVVTAATAKYMRAPMVYVNMVGGQDELIFDGGSFAIDPKGKILSQSIFFSEDLNIVDLKTGEGGFRNLEKNRSEVLRQALVLGLRDYVTKLGFSKVHLGLSGGIDSALVACLAVDALGPHNVKAFALPGPYSSSKSLEYAAKLAANLGIEIKTIPFGGVYDDLVRTIDKALGQQKFSLMHENLQARLRGILLMAVSNIENSLLINTTNKSELASGYGTLYGDLCGAIDPIGDLLKGEVVALSKLYNDEIEIIPHQIIERAPSAELRPNQKDQDSLPPYDNLDKAVVSIMEGGKKARTSAEQFLLKALMKSEFKRWQAPPVLKVRERSFGAGRRFPVVHKAVF
jgi:NAD+ synthase (glutamine-hydrolysing)